MNNGVQSPVWKLRDRRSCPLRSGIVLYFREKTRLSFLFRVGGLLFQKDGAANYLFYPNTENKLTVLYIFVSFLVISP